MWVSQSIPFPANSSLVIPQIVQTEAMSSSELSLNFWNGFSVMHRLISGGKWEEFYNDLIEKIVIDQEFSPFQKPK